MSQSILSVTIPSGNPGAFNQKSCPGGRALPTQIVLGGGGVFDRGWEVAKIQNTGLIPTQNSFFGIHTENETEFAFSPKTVKYAVMFCNQFISWH